MKNFYLPRVLISLCLLFGATGFVPNASVASDGFSDQFNSTSLSPGWTWVDPLGDSSYSLTANPGHLRLYTPDGGHDLYMNLDAPRMMQTITGDFTISTKVTIDPQFNYQGAGLLLWQDANNYVRIERTLVSGIDVWYRLNGQFGGSEEPYSASPTIYLKILRIGDRTEALYSEDNVTWISLHVFGGFFLSESIQAGLVLINQWQDNPIWADFDYFAVAGSAPPTSPCEPNDLHAYQWDMRKIYLVKALNKFPACVVFPVKIAVIDTGADSDHPDLVGHIAGSETKVGPDAEDQLGHGTHVAGIIGATQNNFIGIAGIHPHPRLLIYKFTDKKRINGNGAISLNKLIKLAVNRGAKVINLSIGAPYDFEKRPPGFIPPPCYPHDPARLCLLPLLEDAIKYARDRGVVIVAASDNTGSDGYTYPAAYATKYSNVIAVASSTAANKLASYSTTGSWVTISAPGGSGSCVAGVHDCILSLGLDGGYQELLGTSMAAPHVTGVVALMISINPDLTPAQIRNIIKKTASPFAVTPARQAGAGILNAAAAVNTAKP
jgi:hypothetical protein